MRVGDAGGDVGLHIDRERARRLMQRGLFVHLRHDDIAAQEIAQARARSQRHSDPPSPGRVSLPAHQAVRHALAHDPVAHSQSRRQGAAQTDADDAGPLVIGQGVLQPFCERLRDAAAYDGAQAWASDEGGLTLQACRR
jgi:hypothetical protein